ncbi:MAG: leucine--tRNA ligase [Saprospiraceae bacterium]|nr:leucine--tRNA ligase [Saprospiraceae bacterium]
MDYRPQDIERKWRKYWEDHATYKVSNDNDRPKYYVLDMFPYPSGAGLHVGHPLGYIASDIIARYKRLQGYNVLHPMGFDAFGLPAEQYAIRIGVHPEVSTAANVKTYRKQLDNLGFSYDWSRQINTSDPKYYKWTQTIFLKLFGHYYNKKTDKAETIDSLIQIFEKEGNQHVHAESTEETIFSAQDWNSYDAKEKDDILMNYRLAYRKIGFVNWCEELGTVLANDEVKDGRSERGNHPVIKRPMMQWALRITAYAERLLNGLDQVEFSEALKTQQRNWIGRSEGARIFFDIEDNDAKIEIFTTRPDTIFGATFVVLAPEHELVVQLTSTKYQNDVDAYISYATNRSERERMADKRVTGQFIGAYAINPITKKKLPIYISDYVLIGYGTGAIMAVPSDDERDNKFAKKFGIEIIDVVDLSAFEDAKIGDKRGVMINSDFINGMKVPQAIDRMLEEVEKRGIGQRKVNYRLRDANFSRQRYWGEPFPVKYDMDGVSHPEKNLPLELPELNNFKPTKDGKPPLARAEEWVNSSQGFTRELDTMPGYAGSSWYFLRYMDPSNEEEPFSQNAVNYWQDVDLYLGGAEHAVGHLMYSRFWHKFMHDLGIVPTEEPYKKLVNQGMIQGIIEDVYMLKEKQEGKTVFVSADKIGTYQEDQYTQIHTHIDFVEDYGSEHSYMNEKGIQQFKEWIPEYENAIFDTNDQGHLVTHSEVGKMSKSKYNVINPDHVIEEHGTDCFRMYEMFLGPLEQSKPWDTKGITGVSKFLRKFWNLYFGVDGSPVVTDVDPTPKELKILHTAIKKVNLALDTFAFNVAVAEFMVATRDLAKEKCTKRAILEPLVILIAPFAPHIAEEIWVNALGKEASIHHVTFPKHDEKYLVVSTHTYPIQLGKKVRAKVDFPAEASKDEIEQAIRNSPDLDSWLQGKQLIKVIVVPKRLVNLVAK